MHVHVPQQLPHMLNLQLIYEWKMRDIWSRKGFILLRFSEAKIRHVLHVHVICIRAKQQIQALGNSAHSSSQSWRAINSYWRRDSYSSKEKEF